MKKIELSILVLSLSLLVGYCSSTQECECPKVTEDSKEEKTPSKSEETASSEKSERASAASEATPTKESSEKESEVTTTPTKESSEKESEVTTTPTKESSEKESEVTAATPTKETSEKESSNFPPPKSPIGTKPVNTVSSLLGGSKEEGTASTQTTGTSSSTASRTGSETTEAGSSTASQPSRESESSRDQIRKIDRESNQILPPVYVPHKGSNQSSNIKPAPSGAGPATQPASSQTTKPTESTSSQTTKPIESTSSQTTKPTESTSSQTTKPTESTSSQTTKPTESTSSSQPTKIAFQCDPYQEETKTTLCRGSSSSIKGDAILEFESRSFSRLFLGLDMVLKSGELQVSIPGNEPAKLTPDKPYVFLGQVPTDGQKVVVKLKAQQNEVRDLDYIVRLIYHGKNN